MRWVLLAIACPAIARADVIYLEGLGKAGAYGVGYEHAITHKLALGVAGSYASISDQQVTTVVPYVHVEWLRGARHAMFSDFGLALVHSRLPSPVPEWDGMSDTGAGGEVTLGWEWHPARIVVRTSLGLAAGEGGIAPFLGVAMGVRL